MSLTLYVPPQEERDEMRTNDSRLDLLWKCDRNTNLTTHPLIRHSPQMAAAANCADNDDAGGGSKKPLNLNMTLSPTKFTHNVPDDDNILCDH